MRKTSYFAVVFGKDEVNNCQRLSSIIFCNQKRAALSPRLSRPPCESRRRMARMSKLNAPFLATSLVSHKDCPAAYKKTFRCKIWVDTTLPAVSPVRKQKSIAFSMLTKNRSAALHFQKHNYTRMSDGLFFLRKLLQI